jgi:hypothetical protein
MTAPRDWDKELAEIDKLMGKSPAPPPAVPGSAPALPPARPAAGSAPIVAPPISRKARLGTWIQVLLGVALGAALTQWPYARECGMGLFLYLGAAGLVVLVGLWGALSTWRRRMGLAHTIALLVTLWGLLVVGAMALPRMGYAKVDATWFC